MKPENKAIRNLSRHLRQIRLDKHLSQEELSELVGVDRTYISDLERGLRNPSLKTLAKIADALGETIGALCDSD
jgi:transcriptional regulator with XRE-family HTH domain